MKIERILRRILRVVCLVSMVGLALVGGGDKAASAPASQSAGPLALVQVEPGQITWHPLIPYARLDLTVVKPDGSIFSRSFSAGSLPVLELSETPGASLPDGLYTYELKLTPLLDADTHAALAAAAIDANARLQTVEKLRAAGKLPLVTTMSGAFSVSAGRFVSPDVKEGQDSLVSPASPGAPAPYDVVHADDVIVTGSLCVGFDCLTDGTENFGFDTLKLKENNLQIYFDDTSATAGFPANDWRIVTNDSYSGGANYFDIRDSTASKTPFRIEAGAPTNSLYVKNAGRIGLGTSAPVLKLHMVDGNTPGIRLDQDTSSGWTAQAWDIAGNEVSLFVRDVTGGSKLPFRVQPNSPTDSLTIKADNKIGIGTWSPAETRSDIHTRVSGASISSTRTPAHTRQSASSTAASVRCAPW